MFWGMEYYSLEVKDGKQKIKKIKDCREYT